MRGEISAASTTGTNTTANDVGSLHLANMLLWNSMGAPHGHATPLIVNGNWAPNHYIIYHLTHGKYTNEDGPAKNNYLPRTQRIVLVSQKFITFSHSCGCEIYRTGETTARAGCLR